jgi:hypothetical protein
MDNTQPAVPARHGANTTGLPCKNIRFASQAFSSEITLSCSLCSLLNYHDSFRRFEHLQLDDSS